MVYGQEKLVEDEILEDFLIDLSEWWNEGLSVKKIAEEMEFGEHATKCSGFPELKPHHIYYFVQRYGKEYGMKPRRKPKKKEEEKPQTEIKVGVPYANDMPPSVLVYLRAKGWLLG